MAATLCKALCVPCEYIAKGCAECCKCINDTCTPFCKWLSELFDKPFSGCVAFAVLANLIPGAVMLYFMGNYWSNSCNKNLHIWLLIQCVVFMINLCFGYYIYQKVSKDPYGDNDPDAARLWDPNQSLKENEFKRQWHFFLYDPWVAAFICFSVFAIAWSIVGFVWVGGTSSTDPCPDDLRSASNSAAAIVLVFLGLGFTCIVCTLYQPYLEDIYNDCNIIKCLFCWIYYPFCYKPKAGPPAGPRPGREVRRPQRAAAGRGNNQMNQMNNQQVNQNQMNQQFVPANPQPEPVVLVAQPVGYQQQQQQPVVYMNQQPVVYQQQQPVYQQQQQQQQQQPMQTQIVTQPVQSQPASATHSEEQPGAGAEKKSTSQDVKEKVGAAATAVGAAAGKALGKGFAAAKGLFAKKDKNAADGKEGEGEGGTQA